MVYVPVDIKEAVRKECKRRKYSERTIETYLFCINRFLKFTDKTIDKISKKDVKEFLEYLSESGKSGNTLNTYHMAIRFLFEDVLDKRIWIDIKYSKISEKLPVVLSKEEIKKLFSAIENSTHQLMIRLMYSAGLRVSELINLKVSDLKLNEGYGYVRGGKGNKDRLFIIAESLKQELRKHIGSKKLNEYNYLFVSNRNKKYSIRSLQQIVKKAAKKVGLSKEISCHSLRHSFATHLLENGYSIQDIQLILGHKSPETTFTYLRTLNPNMLNIKSPIDSL